MTNVHAIVVVLILAFALPGCQSSSPRSRPPHWLEGLSVTIPEGAGWQTFSFTREVVLFGKKNFSNGKTFAASAELLRTSDIDAESTDRYLAYIRRNLLAEYGKLGEVTHLTSAQGHALGKYCVENQIVLTSNEGDSPKSAPFIESSYVLMCLHPQSKDHLYRFIYSERAKENDLSKTLTQDAHSFFSGVEFQSLASYGPYRTK
jgi:hypothetical protein